MLGTQEIGFIVLAIILISLFGKKMVLKAVKDVKEIKRNFNLEEDDNTESKKKE